MRFINIKSIIIILSIFIPLTVQASGIGWYPQRQLPKAAELIVIGVIKKVLTEGEIFTTYLLEPQVFLKGKLHTETIEIKTYSRPDNSYELGRSGLSYYHHVFQPEQKVGLFLYKDSDDNFLIHKAQFNSNPATVFLLTKYVFLQKLWIISFIINVLAVISCIVFGILWRTKKTNKWKRLFFISLITLVVGIAFAYINVGILNLNDINYIL